MDKITKKVGLVSFTLYSIGYLWLSGFPYMHSRNVYLYVAIAIILSLCSTYYIAKHKKINSKIYRMATYLIVGWLIGDAIELLYIAIANPPQIVTFTKLFYHYMSLNNLCWLYCLVFGLTFEKAIGTD